MSESERDRRRVRAGGGAGLAAGHARGPAGHRAALGTHRGTAPAAGPKPRTSLAEVVAAGVAIADAEGLESLSMRKVAQRLGIGAMSVYTYVPGRSELIELMIDQVYAEHRLPDPTLSLAGPGRALEPGEPGGSTTLHPWLLDYNMARLPIGPHVLDVEEALYAALLAAGFTGAQNVAVVQPDPLAAARRRAGDDQ